MFQKLVKTVGHRSQIISMWIWVGHTESWDALYKINVKLNKVLYLAFAGRLSHFHIPIDCGRDVRCRGDIGTTDNQEYQSGLDFQGRLVAVLVLCREVRNTPTEALHDQKTRLTVEVMDALVSLASFYWRCNTLLLLKYIIVIL